jgi:hypothetical protein
MKRKMVHLQTIFRQRRFYSLLSRTIASNLESFCNTRVPTSCGCLLLTTLFGIDNVSEFCAWKLQSALETRFRRWWVIIQTKDSERVSLNLAFGGGPVLKSFVQMLQCSRVFSHRDLCQAICLVEVLKLCSGSV